MEGVISVAYQSYIETTLGLFTEKVVSLMVFVMTQADIGKEVHTCIAVIKVFVIIMTQQLKLSMRTILQTSLK